MIFIDALLSNYDTIFFDALHIMYLYTKPIK